MPVIIATADYDITAATLSGLETRIDAYKLIAARNDSAFAIEISRDVPRIRGHASDLVLSPFLVR